MSLNGEQRLTTVRELRANLDLAGLDQTQLQQLTGWSPQRVAATLDLDHADPVDAWQLRDLLEQATCDAGRTPATFTVLTESARAAARGWFGID